MWKRPRNPNDWQQVVYQTSHHLPGPVRRIFRQEIFWQWLYPVWWRYQWWRIMGATIISQPPVKPERYITIVTGPDGGTAGIGDQLSKWNTALVLALKYNLRLAHHPFVRWWGETGWDEFLGFGAGERSYTDVLMDPAIKKVWLPPLDLKVKENKRLRFIEAIITTLYPGDH